MKKVCFFSIADKANLLYFEKMKRSFLRFHPDIPLILYDEEKIEAFHDPDFFYRATPVIARQLLKEYETVIKIDADSIITGDLSALWEGTFDVAVVNNSNPREFKSYPYQLWNIHPFAYVNAGLVSMKSSRFVEHWYHLCMGNHFAAYQMREQDLLNIITQYGDYTVKRMDEGDSFYGLASKGYWPEIVMKEGQLFLAKGEEGWPDKEKFIKVIHVAGGNTPNKMNFRTLFQPQVQKYLEELIT